MRRLLGLSLSLALIFTWVLSSSGEPIDSDVAVRIGNSHLKAERQLTLSRFHTPQSFAMAERERSVAAARELRVEGRLVAYILDLDPQGCIVVSPDTDIHPVIAYSPGGRFSTFDTPENVFLHLVKWDMQNRLDALPVTPQSLKTENNSRWAEYLTEEGKFTTLAASPGVWGPWLRTRWSQGIAYRQQGYIYPDYSYGDYNRYLPIGHSSEWRCVTGCGPTAMAQLFNYWKYPSSMSFSGSDDYTSSNQDYGLTVDIDDDHNTSDFPSFTELNSKLSNIRYYDGDLYFWDAGIWDYRSPVDEDPSLNAATRQEIKEDIAALCFGCGIAMQVNYSPVASPYSATYTPGSAMDYSLLIDRFGYSSATIADVSWPQFYASLEANMRDGQPALIFVDSQSGGQGHTVVADGHRDEWQSGSEGYYHLNFGWGDANPDSVSDSWYHLPEGMPQPDGFQKYSVVKLGVIDIYPPQQGPPSNTPPVASNLDIDPSSPRTTDDLIAGYYYSDADGDPESGSEIRWYKNGAVQLAYNDSLTVSSDDTTKGDVWRFTVRPNDGNSFGATATSASVTIGNTAPVADANGPYGGEAGEAVVFDGSGSSDADGDSPLTYIWTFGNGSGDRTQNSTTTYTYNTPGTYTVTLTVSDGSDSSAPDQTNAVITETDADLEVTKEVSYSAPNEGDTITYTVMVINNGPDDATSVEITDELPSGVSYVSDSPSKGSYNDDTGVWSVGSLANNASASLAITATVDTGIVNESTCGVPITNTASVTDADQGDSNSSNDNDSADIIVQCADLEVNKGVDNSTPGEGDDIAYTITVTNDGPDNATNVKLTDLLPSGVTYVSATVTQGSYNSGTGVWNVGGLSNAASVTLTITAIVDTDANGVPITNSASVTAADQADPDSSNNSDSVNITVQYADLAVNKSVNDPTPDGGDDIIYTVTVTNNGPNTATNVKLIDQLPSGIAYKSATVTRGSYNSGTGLWTVGNLGNRASAILTITAAVDTSVCADSITNTASITASDQADPDISNNSDDAGITVQCADLEVTKNVADPTPDQGDSIIYTITVTNNGPGAATGVEITDVLPSGIAYSSATITQGRLAYVSATVSQDNLARITWTAGGLIDGASATLIIMATVDQSACGVSITNAASVTDVDQADSDASNNSDSADITVKCVDLAVSKSVDNDSPSEGDSIVYTITVANYGANTATDVEITDQLPSGLTYVSGDANGSYNSNTGLWVVGDLSSGSGATLMITATVNTDVCAGVITNIASITAVDQADPDISNNSDTADVTVKCADLEISKDVDSDSPNEGDAIAYAITVTNKGPDAATNVEITDLLPSGVTYTLATVSRGNYNSGTGVWTVGSLDNRASATLTITATVGTGIVNEITCGVPITNTASITAVDQRDPDNSNNSDNADISVKCSDLEVNKSVDNNSPDEGDTIIYTVTVTNNGPDDATNVQIADTLPSGVTYKSATATRGNYNSVKGLWTLRSLNSGAIAALNITAKVDRGIVNENNIGIPITNTASITAVDQRDPDNSNNSDNADITVPCADLAVENILSDYSPNEGDTVTYTISVANNGPDNATNVVVTDQLPSGLAYVSDSPSQGSYNSGVGEWTVGDLNSGASAALAIRAILDDEGIADTVITCTTRVTESDQADPNSGNNSSSISLTAYSVKADLAVNKEVDNDSPNEGNTIVYTLTVINNGPDEATNVELTDPLPPGITYVSDDANGSYDKNTGVWVVDDLDSGVSDILSITATVDTGTCADTITNIASVSAVDQADPNSSNNSDSANIKIQCADLAVSAVVDNPTPNEGDTIVYTVTATNNGPDNATNVKITDLLPSGITYISDDANGSYDRNTSIWSIDELNSGANVILTITATVDTGTSGVTITNTASVTAADQADPDITNNIFSADLVSVKLQLISASYEFMESLLTLVLNDPIDPEQARFDRIGIEIDNNIIPGFSLSNSQGGCPNIVPGIPYEDNGVMLYPVMIDIQCDLLSVLGLAIPAFVTCLSSDMDLVLEPGAFAHPNGGQSPAAEVRLNVTVDGFELRMKGDVSGDGQVTARDAQLILQYIVYGESMLPIYDTVAELSNWLKMSGQNEGTSDIIGYLANTDGLPGITANDAAMVLRYSAGIMDSFCESCAPIANLTRRNGRLEVSNYDDRKLEIFVSLDDVSDVYSADIVVTYDPHALTLTDVSEADATSEWLSEYGTTTPGKLRISLAGAHQPTADGSLVTLSFDAASGDAIKTLDLTELKLNGGRLSATIQNLPGSFALLQNYPNPFNPETWIPYHLSEPADVTITIYSMTGRVVRRLELGNRMPGSYIGKSQAAYWDGKNESGERVSNGIYYYHLQADQDASVRKMVIAQ